MKISRRYSRHDSFTSVGAQAHPTGGKTYDPHGRHLLLFQLLQKSFVVDRFDDTRIDHARGVEF